jgi:hypothetical protein
MGIRSLRQRIARRALLYAATIGVSFGIATSCDPGVRTAIFGGFQGLASGFLDAFFIKLQQTDTGTPVTVQAAPEHSISLFA